MVAQHDDVQLRDRTDHEGNASRITVTDISDTPFGNVSEAFTHAGFDRGYRVAVTETIASLLPATEAFLREHPSSPEMQDLLYRFERFLARRLDASTRGDHWVEGGGGI